VAADGKMARHSFNRPAHELSSHMIIASAAASGVAFGQSQRMSRTARLRRFQSAKAIGAETGARRLRRSALTGVIFQAVSDAVPIIKARSLERFKSG
jgi:hypothetical protein